MMKLMGFDTKLMKKMRALLLLEEICCVFECVRWLCESECRILCIVLLCLLDGKEKLFFHGKIKR